MDWSMKVVQFGTAVLCLILLSGSAGAWALTDPTRPQDLKPEQLQDLGIELEPEVPTYTLQYVLYSSKHRFAVINGKRVREGDRVAEARIISIQPGVVRIRVPGETRELRLGYTDIKKSQGRASR